MAVDTPAKIIVLGAGPIGLEAALYARFLGYDVALFERGQVADNVRRWGHVPMFSPFGMNRSSLGLAAIAAQNPAYKPPHDADFLTGRQWVDAYLLPLAQTDLLAEHVRENCEVLSISREGCLKQECPGARERGEHLFRILYRNAEGAEASAEADIAIDASGVYNQPRWCGDGGASALGERAAFAQIEHHAADILGAEKSKYANQRTLLIGAGYSAATTVAAFRDLIGEAAETQLTWITRRHYLGPNEDANEGGGNTTAPIRRIEGDRLPYRDKLAQIANACAGGEVENISHWPGASLLEIRHDEQRGCFIVRLGGELAGEHEFDRLISNVGYRPDNSLFEELQVHQCYASEGPMKLAAALAGNTSADCLEQTSSGPDTLMNPEPNFYLLGGKSYGRNSSFLVSIGLEQIRELFSVIGGRSDLNLYQGMERGLDAAEKL